MSAKVSLGPFHEAYYEDQLRAMLRSEASAAESKTALAKRIGISPQFLNDMLRGNRRISGRALAFLGFSEITVYYRIGGDRVRAAS